MPPLNTVLRDCVRQLAAVSESPLLDAELLLCHALQCNRSKLYTQYLDDCTPPPSFAGLLARRLAHEPIAYILGSWEFYGLDFHIHPPILVPRPETEHLVEVALDYLGDAPARALDVGTGSGCVAISIAVHAPQARVWASDIRPEAIALACKNAARHHVPLQCLLGDLFAPFSDTAEPGFELIVSNPPYVETTAWEGLSPTIRRYEDVGALMSGEDGLDCIRRLILEARRHLQPGGMLAFEMGESQWPTVATLLEEAGYVEVDVVNDLAGIPRIATAKRPRIT